MFHICEASFLNVHFKGKIILYQSDLKNLSLLICLPTLMYQQFFKNIQGQQIISFLRAESKLITAKQSELEPTLGTSLLRKFVVSSLKDFLWFSKKFYCSQVLCQILSLRSELTFSGIGLYLSNKSSSLIKKYIHLV